MNEDSSDRAYCRAVNLNSAAFQLSLPSCNNENQEYLAIIIPQNTKYSFSKPENDKFAGNVESYQETRNQDFAYQYEPNTCADNRWRSEYRDTIDECGKRVLYNDIKCKRAPIYPRNNIRNDNLKLAPLIPASDKPIFSSQYDNRYILPSKRATSSVHQNTVEHDGLTDPQPELQTIRRKPDTRSSALTSREPKYIECENGRGRRAMCRCRIQSDQGIANSPHAVRTCMPMKSHRPLPRC